MRTIEKRLQFVAAIFWYGHEIDTLRIFDRAVVGEVVVDLNEYDVESRKGYGHTEDI